MASRYCEKCDEAWPQQWPRCPVHDTPSSFHSHAQPTLTIEEAERRANFAAFERHYRETRGIPSDSAVPPLTREEKRLAAAAGLERVLE